MKPIQPDKNGYYGEYGGVFVPELLYENIRQLQECYENIIHSPSFIDQYKRLLKDYVGRPTPLYYSYNLSELYGAQIYLKREDLNHTGSHKINNALGQVLLAKQLNKKRIIAETGAGQHGVATATACALLNMECCIFMGAKDMERQKPNVDRMRMLGAKVIPVNSGSKTLKDATNEAIRDWINHPNNTHYVIGSVVGPHPYPHLVTLFQSVISEEIKTQLQEKTGRDAPDYVIACVGGGSNAMGAFYHFIDNGRTRLIAVEAGGEGVFSGKTAASIALGKKGIIHGSMTYLIQTDDGQIIEPHSVSAGLDYPGIGPMHAYLYDEGKTEVVAVNDKDAIDAGILLCKTDGILPALESAHAIAYLSKMNLKKNDVVVVNLSGRGDKDMITYQKYLTHEQN
jgi:tryptophan synthase beta chain